MPDLTTRRPTRFLTAEQKYEIWLTLLNGELTSQAPVQARVDRSTIMTLRKTAPDGAMAALQVAAGPAAGRDANAARRRSWLASRGTRRRPVASTASVSTSSNPPVRWSRPSLAAGAFIPVRPLAPPDPCLGVGTYAAERAPLLRLTCTLSRPHLGVVQHGVGATGWGNSHWSDLFDAPRPDRSPMGPGPRQLL